SRADGEEAAQRRSSKQGTGTDRRLASRTFRAADFARLSPFVGRQRAVVIEIGGIEMLERGALRFLERNAPILVHIGGIEQPDDRASAHVRVPRFDLPG